MVSILLFKIHSLVKYSNFFSKMVYMISSMSACEVTLVKLLLNNSYSALLLNVLLLLTCDYELNSSPWLLPFWWTVPRPASPGASGRPMGLLLSAAPWDGGLVSPF